MEVTPARRRSSPRVSTEVAARAVGGGEVDASGHCVGARLHANEHAPAASADAAPQAIDADEAYALTREARVLRRASSAQKGSLSLAPDATSCRCMSLPRILLVFPNEWLAYSPTIVNLLALLRKAFEVRVLAFASHSFPRLADPAVTYLEVPPSWRRALGSIHAFNLVKHAWLVRHILAEPAELILAVDSHGVLAAQWSLRPVHMISLEAVRDTAFRACRKGRIESVLIQSRERYDYLFPGRSAAHPRPFLVQNAPTYRERPAGERNGRVVFMGTASKAHGSEALVAWAAARLDLELTFKGVVSREIEADLRVRCPGALESGRIIIDREYLDEEEVVPYLARFSFGVCLYEFARGSDFNYESCPSGKLFRYYAAGVPVIGTRMLGLASVTEFEAGVVVDAHDPASLDAALARLRDDRTRYVEGCLAAARHFSFEPAAEPYVAYLRDCVARRQT